MDWKKLYGKILAPLSVPIRILAPFIIFKYPVIAVVIVFFLDTVDGSFWLQANVKKITYQILDKNLDLWWYTVSLVYAYFHLPFFWLLLSLFVFRLIGHVAFYITRKEKFLALFPNLYENILIFIVIVVRLNLQTNIFSVPKIYIVFLLLSLIKVMHELIVHMYFEKLFGWLPEWLDGPRRK